MSSNQTKPFKTHEEQLEILKLRKMHVESEENALHYLERVNYYRLSEYWYSFRVEENNKRLEKFKPGTDFNDVINLYEYDIQLRQVTFSALSGLEITFRKLLGYYLAEIDPLIHSKPDKLHLSALQKSGSMTKYQQWCVYFMRDVDGYNKLSPNAKSKNNAKGKKKRRKPLGDRIKDHEGMKMAIWVVVEMMSWGTMAHLYDISPEPVRRRIALMCNMTVSQLSSLLHAFNYDRNVCAHQGRFFNASLRDLKDLKSKPLAGTQGVPSGKTYYHLLMIQYLQKSLKVGEFSALPNVLRAYPSISSMPISSMGAPEDWEDNKIWKEDWKKDK